MSTSQTALNLLLSALDPDRELAGEKYEQFRVKLLKFFQWQGAEHPEELADEVIDRVSRKIEEGEQILNMSAYIYGVSRFVLREARGKQQKHLTVVHPTQTLERFASAYEEPAPPEEEQASDCLQQCLDRLTDEERDLILRYYRFEKGAKIEDRRDMAREMGLPLNALRIRAFRIRNKLEMCVHGCVKCLSKTATSKSKGNL